jgi:hypothetical protein
LVVCTLYHRNSGQRYKSSACSKCEHHLEYVVMISRCVELNGF